LRRGEFFEVVGKIIYAGLDCDGNIHLVLRKNNGFWRDVVARFLESEVNRIVKLRIMPWERRRNEGFKNSHKSTFAVRKGEA